MFSVYIKQGAAPAPATAGEPAPGPAQLSIRALRDGDGHRPEIEDSQFRSVATQRPCHTEGQQGKFNFAQVTKGQINERPSTSRKCWSG